jgi:hypothetical protein
MDGGRRGQPKAGNNDGNWWTCENAKDTQITWSEANKITKNDLLIDILQSEPMNNAHW